MKIAFYIAKHGTILDKFIAFITNSKYSHCELVFSDGVFGSASSRDNGVRLKKISLNYHWELFDLNVGKTEEDYMRYWFSINCGQKYDWPGSIMSVFGINWSTHDRKFCSYVCGALLGTDSIVTPEKLHKNLIRENIIVV